MESQRTDTNHGHATPPSLPRACFGKWNLLREHLSESLDPAGLELLAVSPEKTDDAQLSSYAALHGGPGQIIRGRALNPPAGLRTVTGYHEMMDCNGWSRLAGIGRREWLGLADAARELRKNVTIEGDGERGMQRNAEARVRYSIQQGRLCTNDLIGNRRKIEPTELAAWCLDEQRRELDRIDAEAEKVDDALPTTSARRARQGR